MGDRIATSEGDGWSEMEPHDRFLELCALSTSGDLTEEEQKTLKAHLAECPDCRQALKEFEAAADVGMPLLHPHLTTHNLLEAVSVPLENATPAPALSAFPHRNGGRQMQTNWNYVWMPFAAAVALTAALGIYSFQVGKRRGQEVVQTAPSAADTRVAGLEQAISDASHDREALKTQLAGRDRIIADLRRQVGDQTAALNEMKSVQINLEQSLQTDQAEKQQVAQERSTLSQQMDIAQTSLQKKQTELDSLRQQRAQDQSRSESFETQIRELHAQLREQEQEFGKQQELLSHDRDIRELMGARDLYIAEVYDVARDGQTQKPYGRVFYTKGKSLVFYAYDLDQQAGLKNASTFQAWGSRGADRQQATSLGVFYEDNAAKKRWVLKFDDPKKLEEINAVFVTVEPNGGSHKPSGKPLLFAYLKVDPNHP